MAARRKRRTVRRVHRRKRTGMKRAAPRRRTRTRSRRRRNWAVAGPVVPLVNPHRRRSRRRRSNPVRRRRHHMRRNPAFLGLALPSLKTVGYGALGFAAPSVVSSLLMQFAPSLLQTTSSLGVAGKYLTRIGSVLGVAYLVKKFGGDHHAVLIGGAVNVVLTGMNDFMPGLLPANPLAMYVPATASLPSPGARMSGYVPTRPGMRGPATNFPRIPKPAPFTAGRGYGTSVGMGIPSRYYRM